MSRFKVGDPVWVDNGGGPVVPPGTHAGVLLRRPSLRDLLEVGQHESDSWWIVDIEGDDRHQCLGAPERILRPRGDPPPREALGTCEGCGWEPADRKGRLSDSARTLKETESAEPMAG